MERYKFRIRDYFAMVVAIIVAIIGVYFLIDGILTRNILHTLYGFWISICMSIPIIMLLQILQDELRINNEQLSSKEA